MNTGAKGQLNPQNWPEGSVPSPCISVCKMHSDTGLCIGCWRTIEEIIAWGQASDAYKREAWQRIGVRREQYEANK